jgi:hypothetical protein
MLCVSDLCPVAWIPAILWIIMWAISDTTEVDEPYTPKRERIEKGSWYMSNVPTAWRRWLTAAHQRAASFVDKGQPSRRKTPHRYISYSPSHQRRRGRAKNRGMARSLRLIAIACLSASTIDHSHAFDSDSVPIAIDNCSRKDFKPGTIKPCNISVAGISGAVRCRLMGTVSWTIEDDQGRSHDFEVADTPLCTALPHRLFSPQQWA